MVTSGVVRIATDGHTHVWPCSCPEHIGTDKRPPGHTIQLSWYQPLDDRELAIHQALLMAQVLAGAGFSDLDVLIDGKPVTRDLMEAYGI